MCDHSPARATLAAFRAATVRPYWLDDDGEGGIALYANCKRCASTIGIAVQEVRASVTASGTIEGLKLCTKNNWCGDEDGHAGDCMVPF